MASVSRSPCTVLTSIGKNTITTTTAALDCQSKPNHITRIGAMPMIGRAATKFPTGSRPRCRKGKLVDGDGDEKGRAAAKHITGQRALDARSARNPPTGWRWRRRRSAAIWVGAVAAGPPKSPARGRGIPTSRSRSRQRSPALRAGSACVRRAVRQHMELVHQPMAQAASPAISQPDHCAIPMRFSVIRWIRPMRPDQHGRQRGCHNQGRSRSGWSDHSNFRSEGVRPGPPQHRWAAHPRWRRRDWPPWRFSAR